MTNTCHTTIRRWVSKQREISFAWANHSTNICTIGNGRLTRSFDVLVIISHSTLVTAGQLPSLRGLVNWKTIDLFSVQLTKLRDYCMVREPASCRRLQRQQEAAWPAAVFGSNRFCISIQVRTSSWAVGFRLFFTSLSDIFIADIINLLVVRYEWSCYIVDSR